MKLNPLLVRADVLRHLKQWRDLYQSRAQEARRDGFRNDDAEWYRTRRDEVDRIRILVRTMPGVEQ